MDRGEIIVKLGTVEDTEDPSFGYRIKARINQDASTSTEDLPWSSPLLPQMFHVIPKKGEGVLIFTTAANSKESQRYYLGPIISQPQYMEECKYNYGTGQALSLVLGGLTEPLETLRDYTETDGSFPSDNEKFKNDVAILGRTSQDIILRDNDETKSQEIDIRCGIKKNVDNLVNPNSREVNALKGNVMLNRTDPAYIQLKYKQGLVSGNETQANSVVNVVADKVNIVSNQDQNGFELTDPEELIPEEKMKEMMEKLHQLPHGDVLVEYLSLLRKAFLTHVHNFNGLPPVLSGSLTDVLSYRLNDILSKNVRIS